MADDRRVPVTASPPARLLWSVVGALAAVLALGFTTQQTIGLVAHEERTEVRTVDAAGLRAVVVDTESGGVEVVGADRDDVRIRARVSDGLTPTRYRVDVVGGELRVSVGCRTPLGSPWCRVGLRIEVPRALAVRVRALDQTVVLRDLSGEVRARTIDGAIRADQLVGPVVALRSNGGNVEAIRGGPRAQVESTHGRVRVELAVAAEDVSAETTTGEVEVAVARTDDAYRLEVESLTGSRQIEVRTDPASDRRILVRATLGDVTVRYVD